MTESFSLFVFLFSLTVASSRIDVAPLLEPFSCHPSTSGKGESKKKKEVRRRKKRGIKASPLFSGVPILP
jgi:hypothetical protein